MKIYIICPVRAAEPGVTDAIREYANNLRAEGHEVHFPPDDVNQSDETGFQICCEHLRAMKSADRVDVFWDSQSFGSHFDLGMAFALGTKVNAVMPLCPDRTGKSYWKVITLLHEGLTVSA